MKTASRLISLSVTEPIWNRFFSVAPLVLVGSMEEDGRHDLAPKHMAMPMSWDSYFGFVCTPRHGTYRNARRTGFFTVSYPRPSQILEISLSAEHRDKDGKKPDLLAFPVFPSKVVPGVLVEGCYMFLECEMFRVIDDMGENSLLIGKVVAAYVDASAERNEDRDDSDVISRNPLLAYLAPGRFSVVDESYSFPYPSGFSC